MHALFALYKWVLNWVQRGETPLENAKYPQNIICQDDIVHKVWSWSLGGLGVTLTGVGMFRTPVFIV